MTDATYNKQDPTILHHGFIVKPMVFMALTNCFRKNFMDYLCFAFIDTFCDPMIYCTQSKIRLNC